MNESIYLKNNFLSDAECDFLVSYFEDRESSTYYYECNKTNTLLLRSSTVDNIDDQLKPFFNKIQNLITKLEDSNLYVNVSEIVKWPSDSSKMNPHLDREDDLFGIIIYLNDDFIGGKTYFENGIMITPKKGSILFFTGNKIRHGVTSSFGNDRFTLACWIRSK